MHVNKLEGKNVYMLTNQMDRSDAEDPFKNSYWICNPYLFVTSDSMDQFLHVFCF